MASVSAIILLASANSREAWGADARPKDERPKDERPKGVTRSYDLYDFFWYTEDGGDSEDGQATRQGMSESPAPSHAF